MVNSKVVYLALAVLVLTIIALVAINASLMNMKEEKAEQAEKEQIEAIKEQTEEIDETVKEVEALKQTNEYKDELLRIDVQTGKTLDEADTAGMKKIKPSPEARIKASYRKLREFKEQNDFTEIQSVEVRIPSGTPEEHTVSVADIEFNNSGEVSVTQHNEDEYENVISKPEHSKVEFEEVYELGVNPEAFEKTLSSRAEFKTDNKAHSTSGVVTTEYWSTDIKLAKIALNTDDISNISNCYTFICIDENDTVRRLYFEITGKDNLVQKFDYYMYY